MKKENSILKTVDKIISISLVVFIIVATFASLFFTINKAQNKIVSIFGYSICYVVTGSMEPALAVGDAILIKKVSVQNINEQDIITYKSATGVLSGNFITHRVIEKHILNDIITFTTKGDANTEEDAEVITEEKIYGVFVKKLSFIKFLMSILSNFWSFFIIVVLPLFISLTMQMVNFAIELKNKKE